MATASRNERTDSLFRVMTLAALGSWRRTRPGSTSAPGWAIDAAAATSTPVTSARDSPGPAASTAGPQGER